MTWLVSEVGPVGQSGQGRSLRLKSGYPLDRPTSFLPATCSSVPCVPWARQWSPLNLRVHCAERVVGLSGDQRTGMPDQTTSRKGSDAASSSRTDSSASTPIRGDFPTWVEFDPKAGTLVFA